tara:strand:+ start:1428 stop:2159 length:732 start_codon:yes stop_codon:yes gene_type:complete
MKITRPLILLILLVLFWAGVCFTVSGCAQKSPNGIKAIDATTPKTSTEVSLEEVREPLGNAGVSIVKAALHAEGNEAKIKKLEFALLAAKSHTEKLLKLAALLEMTEMISKQELEVIASGMVEAAKDHEAGRVKNLVVIGNLKDDNSKLRTELINTKFSFNEGLTKLAEKEVAITTLTGERNGWKVSYDGLKIISTEAIKDRDNLQDWKNDNKWKATTVNWIIGIMILYLLAKIVMSKYGIRI